jgi:DNA processing protein
MTNRESDVLAVLQLIGTPGITPSRVRAVVELAMRRQLRVAEVLEDDYQLKTLLSTREVGDFVDHQAKALLKYRELQKDNIMLISIDDFHYPAKVKRRLGSSSPPLLFTKGNLNLINSISVGFCGSRRVSEKGLQVTLDCAQQISQAKINIVSGYAAGVDLATHRAAFENGGTTTIVLPEGIGHFRIRRDLKDCWDWSKVLVVSQFFPSVPWRVENAMKRNEVICTLSDALIVIEAGSRGGSVEAGRTALSKSVPVYAPVYEGMPVEAVGNRELLERGARPLLRSRSKNCASLGQLLDNVLTPAKTVDLFSKRDGT